MNDTAIVNSPLPPTTNFYWLKKQSIERVQTMVQDEWTDFNESDPGVTIIEQLCYALTELGYCIDFPIEDILTTADGHIRYENQFFTPQDILTCSPVCPMDYRKLLLDALPYLRNVYIDTNSSNLGVLGDYHVYLLPDSSWMGNTDQKRDDDKDMPENNRLENIADEVLNRHRNLAEWFRTIKVLKVNEIGLKVTVQLKKGARIDVVESKIQTTLDEFVSPQVQRNGYQALRREGMTNDQIFNGPLMIHGWITNDQLERPKVNKIDLNDVSAMISSVSGVQQVVELCFSDNAETPIRIEPKQIAKLILREATYLLDGSRITLNKSKNSNADSSVNPKTKDAPIGSMAHRTVLSHDIELNDDLARLKKRSLQEDVSACKDIAPELPHGRYRDISDYYSIQNTFPPEFAVGEESVPIGASAFRRAQAKQLKGYLTLFDQILANQFSQLAHVGQLFSFGSPTIVADKYKKRRRGNPDTVSTVCTGLRLSTPTKDTRPTIVAHINGNENDVVSGIPYQLFPPTYFCQPLYQIPDIQPLLVGNQMYRYGPEPITSNAQKHEVWRKFQADPFNPYMYRMRKFLERDAERDSRRNRMLNHLLARHGELPEKIDEIISAARWCGSTVQTQIILKSILLQNYRLLSYSRQKAYSTLFADKLGTPGRYRLTVCGFNNLSHYGIEKKWLEPFVDEGYQSKKGLIYSILKSEPIAKHIQKERIDEFERRCLIIEDGHQTGPSMSYHLYRDGRLDLEELFRQEKLCAQDFNNFSTAELRLNLLLGLQQHYQTVTDVMLKLVNDERFEKWVEAEIGGASFILQDAGMTITVIRHIKNDTIFFGSDSLLKVNLEFNKNDSNRSLYSDYIDQLQWLGQKRKGLLLMEPISWVQGLKDTPYVLSLCSLITIVAIPDYLSVFYETQSRMRIHMEQLIEQLWPTHVKNYIVRLDYSDMNKAISAFIKWHNLLRYNEGPFKCRYAKELATLFLPKVYPNEYGDDV